MLLTVVELSFLPSFLPSFNSVNSFLLADAFRIVYFFFSGFLV